MRVAAYQAPYLAFGSFEAVAKIHDQLGVCEAAGVDILCCPEAVIGGLAHEADGQDQGDVALVVGSREFFAVLGPLLGTPVTVVVGFTERDDAGSIFDSAAVIAGGALVGVYRKVFPGYRTAVEQGTDLAVFFQGATPFGVIVCNDIWYLEPARVLAAAGAALLMVPSNSGHVRDGPGAGVAGARGRNLPIARAVENTMTVVVADICGRRGAHRALGCTRIVDPDGIVLAESDAGVEGLVIADVEAQRRSPGSPRGWDGFTNSTVTEAFLALWHPG